MAILVGIVGFLLPVSLCLGADFGSVAFYQSYAEMTQWADGLATDNPDLVQVYDFGSSAQGRAMLAIHITQNVAAGGPSKPQFLFTAGIHAREVVGSQAAYELAQYLVDGYRGGDQAVLAALSKRDVWIVPDMNPDGRVYVEEGNSAHRKNMQFYSGQDTTNPGVDLNRNFPHRWSDASNYVWDDQYRGPSVLSTPEDSALWNMLQDTSKFPNLLAAIDFHSGAQTILAPWVSPADFSQHPLPAEDRAKFDALSGTMSSITGLSTQRLSYNSYGTLSDSLYERFHAYALAEEIYMGSGDIFSLFNPTTEAVKNQQVGKAIDSAMYMLSDAAFDVPEPATLCLLALGACVVIRRKR